MADEDTWEEPQFFDPNEEAEKENSDGEGPAEEGPRDIHANDADGGDEPNLRGDIRSVARSEGDDRVAPSFKSDQSIPQHMERVRQQLGVINRYIESRATQKIQRDHVIRLAKAFFDFQFQDLQHHLLLEMDVQKKRRFVQYLAATKEVQNKLQRHSAEAQLALIETMFDMRMEAFRSQRERDDRISRTYRSGGMSREQYDRAIRDSLTLTNEQEQRLNQTMDKMIERHSQFLFQTLSLFKTDLINDGKI